MGHLYQSLIIKRVSGATTIMKQELEEKRRARLGVVVLCEGGGARPEAEPRWLLITILQNVATFNVVTVNRGFKKAQVNLILKPEPIFASRKVYCCIF